jgi:hypothetical protein
MPTQFLQSVLASSDRSDKEASKGMQGCIKRMVCRGASAGVVAMGQRGAGRRLRRMKVDQNRVLVLLLDMAPRTTNSWLPRPPYPPSSKMSATTRLCRHAEAGPGARAAKPHTHAAIPVSFGIFLPLHLVHLGDEKICLTNLQCGKPAMTRHGPNADSQPQAILAHLLLHVVCRRPMAYRKFRRRRTLL